MNRINKLIGEFEESESTGGSTYKSALIRKRVLKHLLKHKKSTISELAHECVMSVPKVNELIVDLVESKIVKDLGKELNGVGRKPNFYGLNPLAAYFLVVEVNRSSLNIAIIDFNEEIVEITQNPDYRLENTNAAYEVLCACIEEFLLRSAILREDIIGLGLTITGRVNHYIGQSFSYFNFLNKSLAESLKERFHIPAIIENDTRAMVYGEFCKGVVEHEKQILYLYLDEGVGMGIIVNGQLYSGKSGFAGEFGHLPILDNDIICHCGKKGCLETEVSGLALVEEAKKRLAEGTSSILIEKYQLEDIKIKHIVDAALRDDPLCIEIISNAGEKIGKGIALLLNLFNPELVVLGGELSNSKSLILLPILSSMNKHSLNLVNTDTKFVFSTLGAQAGILGVSLLLRNRLLFTDF